MRNLKRIPLIIAVTLLSLPCFAQFGGHDGDVVIYAVTAGGSGDFQVVPPGTANTAQSAAAFHVTSLSKVPVLTSEPFVLGRQPFYQTPTETFAVGTDSEGTVGLHRLFLMPVKVLEIAGVLNPAPGVLGSANSFINFPQGLDVAGDIALETEQIAVWYPGVWPFITVTDHRGSLGPPELTGFEYFFTRPDGLRLPRLIPWVPFFSVYPSSGWRPGADLKMLDTDATLGTTIRQLRLRPGAKTPPFRIPGHTHLFVLQGNVTIQPAASAPIVMNQNDYAFVPENFAITLSNPAAYAGPVAR